MNKPQRYFMAAIFVVLLVGGLGILAGCKYQVEQVGPTLTEDATVVDLAYVPAGHGSGSGLGISAKGDLSVSSVSVHIPARYAVVFQCPHGKFVVEGSQHEALWKRLRKDQRVRITYREVLECTKEDGVVHGCVARDLDFLDAIAVGVE